MERSEEWKNKKFNVHSSTVSIGMEQVILLNTILDVLIDQRTASMSKEESTNFQDWVNERWKKHGDAVFDLLIPGKEDQ